MPLNTKPPINSKLTPISTTIFAILLATFLCISLTLNIIKQNQQELEIETLKVQKIVEDEFKTFVFGMQGVKGVLVTDQFRVDQRKFRAYAESRDLFNNFPGALGFGFVRSVKNKDLGKYIQEQKKINPRLKVQANPLAEQHLIVEQIEPIENNFRLLGSDFSNEPQLQEAALSAAKTGETIISDRTLIFDNGQEHPGFVFFLPVYKSIKTPTSEAARLEALIGWVYTPIMINNLVERIKLKIPFGLNVNVKAENDTVISFSNLKIKTSNSVAYVHTNELQVGGRSWKVHVTETSRNIVSSLAKIFTIYILGIMVIVGSGYLLFLNFKGKDRSLVEKTKWLNSVINSAAHAVFATRPDGKIIMFNPAAEKMLGYKADELIGKQTSIIFYDPEEVALRAQSLSKELNKKVEPGRDTFTAKVLRDGSDTNEWTFYKKNQERINVRLCTTAIHNAQNQLIGYLGIAEDLTEQKKLLSTIEYQRAKMHSSAKMSLLGEMAGRIAHEINTPLAIINSHASVLREKINLSKDTREDNLNRLGKIEITVNRIAKIVKSLRSFSRNSEHDAKVLISVKSVIDSTLDLCNEKLTQDQVDLRLSIDDQAHIMARSTEIGQVLMNLINNSMDAISDLPEKWIDVKCYHENDRVLISVTDSGPGIPQSIIEKIMIPFFTTKEVGKGTGLGLSISKGIVESHDGTLEYDQSSPHTRFVLSLPAAQPSTYELKECTL